MTTTNLPTDSNLLTDEIQESYAKQHADQACDTQLAIAQLQQLRDETPQSTRIQERHHTLQHEEQGERGKQVRQMKGHERGSVNAASWEDDAQRFAPGSFRYLKKSPSGVTTMTAVSWPREFS